MDVELYLCRPEGIEGSYVKLVLRSDLTRNGGNFLRGATSTLVYDGGSWGPVLNPEFEDATIDYPLVDPEQETDWQFFKDKDCTVFNFCDRAARAKQLPLSMRYKEGEGLKHFKCWETPACYDGPKKDRYRAKCLHDAEGDITDEANWRKESLKHLPREDRRKSQNLFTKVLINAITPEPFVLAYGWLAPKVHCQFLRAKKREHNAEVRLQAQQIYDRMGTIRMDLPWKVQRIFRVGFMELRVHYAMLSPVSNHRSTTSLTHICRHPRL